MPGRVYARSPWDYEDDHDWDDATDYAAKGSVYWYGKYYPKEHVGEILGIRPEIDVPGIILRITVFVGSAAAALVGVWGAVKVAPKIRGWLTDTVKPAIKSAIHKQAPSEEANDGPQG